MQGDLCITCIKYFLSPSYNNKGDCHYEYVVGNYVYTSNTFFYSLFCFALMQCVSGRKVSILGGHSVGHSKQKMYVSYSKQFPRWNISVYTSKIVHKKEMLYTVIILVIIHQETNLLQFTKYNTLLKIHIVSGLCTSCEDLVRCSSIQ